MSVNLSKILQTVELEGMYMSTAKEYENDIGDLLDVFFADMNIAAIRIRKSLKYSSERGYKSYSPLIDVSIGPFSEQKGLSLWGRL